MDIEKKKNTKTKLTEEQIKEKRKKYMRDYYKKKTERLRQHDPKDKKPPKPPSVPPLKIIHKEVVVSFN